MVYHQPASNDRSNPNPIDCEGLTAIPVKHVGKSGRKAQKNGLETEDRLHIELLVTKEGRWGIIWDVL